MPGEREQRAPKSEKAFRMTTREGGTARPVVKEKAETKKKPRPPKETPPAPERKPDGPRGYRAIKLAASIVVLACFFVLGVLVGRGSAPVSFDIDGLRNQLVTASSAISERIAQIKGGESEVSFYDDLGLADADITISDPRSYRPEYSVAPQGPVAAEESAVTTEDGEGQEETIAAEETYDGKTLEPKVKPKTDFSGYLALQQPGASGVQTRPAAQPQPQPAVQERQPPVQQQPERKPESAAVVAGSEVPKGSFSVQVAALRNEADAKKFLQSLGQKGFSGRVEKTVVGEGTWYRIRIGVYKTRAQAEEDLQRLVKAGIKSPMIVTN